MENYTAKRRTFSINDMAQEFFTNSVLGNDWIEFGFGFGFGFDFNFSASAIRYAQSYGLQFDVIFT